MASRFPQRPDPRQSLFENYNPPPSATSTTKARRSPVPSSRDGGYGMPSSSPYGGEGSHGGGLEERTNGGFRVATPNKRGQYSDAVLNELESQNDSEISGILGKVQQLKSMTIAIGDEIRSSSALAQQMNDSFDNTRTRLKGTMNRMLVMAQKTGIGWRVWLAFFGAVGLLFWYVWAIR